MLGVGGLDLDVSFILIVLPLSIVIGDALADQDMSAATKKYNQYMITTGDVYLRELSSLQRFSN